VVSKTLVMKSMYNCLLWNHLFCNWHGIFVKVNLLMNHCMKLSNYIICWQLNMWFN